MRPRIILWGTGDFTKPRVRLLVNCVQQESDVKKIHFNVWQGVIDKSVLNRTGKLLIFLRLMAIFPILLLRYIVSKPSSAVLLTYPGYIETIIISVFARLRREKIILDAFIPIYNTIIEDRQLLPPTHLVARIVFIFEKLSLKMAQIVLTDTYEHAVYFSSTFHVPLSRFRVVPVGAENIFWDQPYQKHPLYETISADAVILFYGQMIPLHGIQTILEAAHRMRDKNLFWLIVGKGQDEHYVRQFVEQHSFERLKWIPWIPYEELPHLIDGANICLGIFGTSDKSDRVIPNKIYQYMARNKPIITRQSTALQHVFTSDIACLELIEAGSAEALVGAIDRLLHHKTCQDRKSDENQQMLPGPEVSIKALISELS